MLMTLTKFLGASIALFIFGGLALSVTWGSIILCYPPHGPPWSKRMDRAGYATVECIFAFHLCLNLYNMSIDEKKTEHISEVNGKKVYLCSSSCKSQFDKDPKKYGY